MPKITPDPPHSNPTPPNHLNRNRVTPGPSRATQQNLPRRLFHVRESISAEEALTTACEVLDCACATAYAAAEQLHDPNRMLTLALVYLVETAQELVESALNADRSAPGIKG